MGGGEGDTSVNILARSERFRTNWLCVIFPSIWHVRIALTKRSVLGRASAKEILRATKDNILFAAADRPALLCPDSKNRWAESPPVFRHKKFLAIDQAIRASDRRWRRSTEFRYCAL